MVKEKEDRSARQTLSSSAQMAPRRGSVAEANREAVAVDDNAEMSVDGRSAKARFARADVFAANSVAPLRPRAAIGARTHMSPGFAISFSAESTAPDKENSPSLDSWQPLRVPRGLHAPSASSWQVAGRSKRFDSGPSSVDNLRIFQEHRAADSLRSFQETREAVHRQRGLQRPEASQRVASGPSLGDVAALKALFPDTRPPPRRRRHLPKCNTTSALMCQSMTRLPRIVEEPASPSRRETASAAAAPGMFVEKSGSDDRRRKASDPTWDRSKRLPALVPGQSTITGSSTWLSDIESESEPELS